MLYCSTQSEKPTEITLRNQSFTFDLPQKLILSAEYKLKDQKARALCS